MNGPLFKFILAWTVFPLVVSLADSDWNGRWRLDVERSSALDGWTNMDIGIKTSGSEISITHDMRWRSTRVLKTNVMNTGRTVKIPDFFRIEARHMAVYAPKTFSAMVSSEWLDGSRALRVEAELPVEVSQGDATIRIYSEYRMGEGGETLTLIELRSSRNNPLVYRFRRLPVGDSSRP